MVTFVVIIGYKQTENNEGYEFATDDEQKPETIKD